MNLVVISDFLAKNEQLEIKEYASSMPKAEIFNEHIREVNDRIKGKSILCDLTKTSISKNISKFQGDATEVQEVPAIMRMIGCRIAEKLKISAEHTFVQCIASGDGGQVAPHYDAAMPGYITYKCNVAIEGPKKDLIFIAGRAVEIQPGDLYCFEANLYKHWANTAPPRILLSYGFLLPLQVLGWNKDDPRVRMSDRIWNKFSNS